MSRISRARPRACARPAATADPSAAEHDPEKVGTGFRKRSCSSKPRGRGKASAGLATLLHVVPPGTDAGHAVVVALDHLHRLALAVLGRLDAEQARFLFLFRRHPAALVAPQARTELALERLPGVVVDQLPAPAVFHQEAGRIPGVERGDVVAGMAAERDADTLGIAAREIVALADVVEAEELHHHVVDHVDAALDEGNAVMARIDVEEIR